MYPMKFAFILPLALAFTVQTSNSKEKEAKRKDFLTYLDARNAIMDAEELLATGGRIELSDKEKKADRILMTHKLSELTEGYYDADFHAPGMHFFKAKDLIESSKVFEIIRMMPKGALLHAHNSALVSSEWVISNLTYMPGLMSCIDQAGVTVFSFRESPKHDCSSSYKYVSTKRLMSWNKNTFDQQLETTINLFTAVPELKYPTINKVWDTFQNFFKTMSDVLRYIPAYRAYHWRLLEEMFEDNIMYVELRMEFKELYDAEGKEYPPDFAADELLKIVNRFRVEYPDFIGAKVIYSTSRWVEKNEMRKQMDTFKYFHKKYPDFVIGFDLVGQEDLGYPLYDFVDILKTLPPTAKYYFHAGETNWFGASTDYNLLDAILLNTTRIGHGYALLKHPVLWNTIKTLGIPIEINPISNQVLGLVWDLRNHPAAFYLAENVPVVIASDDPGFWNAKGLSYDFYYAIMSFAPNHAGLKTLKQLVWDSIKYSMLNATEREEANKVLELTWDEFLDEVIAGDILRL